MADAEDNNGASGGAGENPEEEEEALVEGIEALALEQPQEDIAKLPRVFLKLETTGDKSDIHITRIKAQCGKRELSICVDPSIPTEEQTSAESGNTPVGQPGKHVGIREALQGLIHFLRTMSVALVGHNIEENIGHLLREARRCRMTDQLGAVIRGFVDARPLFRKCAQEFESLASVNRDPTADELASPGISAEAFSRIFSSLTQFENRLSWRPLVEEEIITDHIMKNAVRSQLHFDTVRQAFAEGGEKKAREVLKQRVTKHQRILDDICGYIRRKPEQ